MCSYIPLNTHDKFILNSGSIKKCSQVVSKQVKQHTVIKFLTAENIIPTKIHHHLKVGYDEDAANLN